MLDSMTMTRLSFELAMIRMFAQTLLQNSFYHKLLALTANFRSFFRKLLSVADDFSLLLNREDLATFLSICHDLENDELRQIDLDVLFGGSPLSLENGSERLRMKRLCGGDYSSELEFVRDSVGDLGIEYLELILNSPSLVAVCEDWLYELISWHFDESAG
jgi:hypothetical protein